MPKQAAERKEGPLRTTQVFLAWSELSHIYDGSSQIWNVSLKYESDLSSRRCIHLSTRSAILLEYANWALSPDHVLLKLALNSLRPGTDILRDKKGPWLRLCTKTSDEPYKR